MTYFNGNHIASGEFNQFLADQRIYKTLCDFCEDWVPEVATRKVHTSGELICECCIANISIESIKDRYPDGVDEVIGELFPTIKRR